MDRIIGSNIVLDIGGKKLAGYTDIDFTMTPEFIETLTKEDKGKAKKKRTDRSSDVEFSVNGLHYITESGDLSTHSDIEAMRSTANAGTVVAFIYGSKTGGRPILSGSAVITSLSEKSGSKGYGNWSLNLRKVGTLTFGTRPGS